MESQDRLQTYLNLLHPDLTPFLLELESIAKDADVPIIRKDTQNFLRMMMQLHAPKSILEVGTAVGFSTILMATYAPADCQITTIENYEKRILLARNHFEQSGFEDQITLLAEDAMEALDSLEDTYDFVFMDAAKGQYPAFLPKIKPLLHKGSVFITDNVLQEHEVIESHYAVVRRNRTIHKRMREYLYELTHDEDFVTDILPIGDGIAVCVRK